MNEVKTRWVSPQCWMVQPAGPGHGRLDLLHLAEASLARGHHKVALQRLLKLRALGRPVPDELDARLQAAWQRLSLPQRRRMHAAAEDWARMVRANPFTTC